MASMNRVSRAHPGRAIRTRDQTQYCYCRSRAAELPERLSLRSSTVQYIKSRVCIRTALELSQHCKRPSGPTLVEYSYCPARRPPLPDRRGLLRTSTANDTLTHTMRLLHCLLPSARFVQLPTSPLEYARDTCTRTCTRMSTM